MASTTTDGKTYIPRDDLDTDQRKGEIAGLPSGQPSYVRVRPWIHGSGYGPWIELHIIVT
jgi:hypothetical protein